MHPAGHGHYLVFVRQNSHHCRRTFTKRAVRPSRENGRSTGVGIIAVFLGPTRVGIISPGASNSTKAPSSRSRRLTPHAFHHARGTRFSRSAYLSHCRQPPTSIFTPLPNTSTISFSPCLSTYSSKTVLIASAWIASSTCFSDIWWLPIM